MNPRIALNDGAAIPQLGLGVWQVPQEEAAGVVAEALRVGYRHIDTAQGYGNEQGVGEGVRRSGLDRDELFITTKVHNDSQGHQRAIEALQRSLERLGLDQVDLYLIHWTQPRLDRYLATWEGLIEARELGLTRSIGVSNFHEPHLERIITATGAVPAVNQIELHPMFTQERLVAATRRLGDPGRELEPAGQRARARRSDAGPDRRCPSPVRGAGCHPLASAAGVHRDSQVDHAGAHRGELRCLRLRALARRDAADRGAGPGPAHRTRSGRFLRFAR